MIWAALAHAIALAGPPTVEEWVGSLGPPSKDVTLAARVRSADEPLLLYWRQTLADPLEIGVDLPGTLVANFVVEGELAASVLHDFTFLAVANARQVNRVQRRVRRWIINEQVVERAGGVFRELSLVLPDGRQGTLAIRQTAAGGALADGRPSPTLWLHMTEMAE